MDGWTPWEKERVTQSVLENWSDKAPKETWEWYQANRNRFDQDFSPSILPSWAESDPEGLKGLLSSMEQPGQRKAAIEALGKALATKNTEAAVNWANSLADAGEREIANRAVYDGAPRGIGAVLGFEKGFPIIRGIVPGSPLEGSGVQPGDQIVELWEANGSKQPLYATDLKTTISLIRGEAGSELTLRLLRQNKNSGQLEEHLVPVTRRQLYLKEKALPDPGRPALR
jgi:C-terminal processing protease CtpA/Prc